MSKNLEIESKCMINKSDYVKLLDTFKNEKKYTQINHYISSKEMTPKANSIGMRIRYKNKKFELTIKIKEKIGKTEINQDISRKSYVFLKYFHIFPKGEAFDYLKRNNACDISKLRIIGKMKTTRTDINFNDSLISIDMSKYNGLTDYEIECESKTLKDSIRDLILFLNQNSIEYKKSEQTKLTRFLNSL